jgi:hypothetical protein
MVKNWVWKHPAARKNFGLVPAQMPHRRKTGSLESYLLRCAFFCCLPMTARTWTVSPFSGKNFRCRSATSQRAMPGAIIALGAGTGYRPSCGPRPVATLRDLSQHRSDFGHDAGCGVRSPRYFCRTGQLEGTALVTRVEVGDPSSPLLFNSLSAGAKSPHHLKEPPIPTLPEVTIGIEGAHLGSSPGYAYRRAPRYCVKSEGQARRRTRHRAHSSLPRARENDGRRSQSSSNPRLISEAAVVNRVARR